MWKWCLCDCVKKWVSCSIANETCFHLNFSVKFCFVYVWMKSIVATAKQAVQLNSISVRFIVRRKYLPFLFTTMTHVTLIAANHYILPSPLTFLLFRECLERWRRRRRRRDDEKDQKHLNANVVIDFNSFPYSLLSSSSIRMWFSWHRPAYSSLDVVVIIIISQRCCLWYER